MTRKRMALLLLLAVVVAFLVWTIRDAFTFAILTLALVSFVVHGTVYGATFLAIAAVVWRVMPRSLREDYRGRRVRFGLVVLVCLLIAGYVGLYANRNWLPYRLHPVSLAADALILIFVALVGYVLLRPSLRSVFVLVPGGALLATAMVVVVVLGKSVSGASDGTSTRKLAALPYLSWVPAGESLDKSGVTYYDSTRAQPGVNLYCPRTATKAFLVAMDGETVHEWSRRVFDYDDWGHVVLYPDGDLLVMVGQHMLLKLDWESKIQWLTMIRSHHDMRVMENGDIYVLARKQRWVRHGGIPLPILDDVIVVLSPDGEPKQEISLYDAFADRVTFGNVYDIYRYLLNPRAIGYIVMTHRLYGYELEASRPVDVLHSNSLQVIDRDYDATFRKGNILICSRSLDTIAVLDPRSGEIVWSWGPGEIEWPHHPTLLDNGHIILFDNGAHRRYSRIVELDPFRREIVWEFRGDPAESFFSYTRGGVQRMPNGNTLITNSDSGQAFEVTPDGEVVWEFFNPDIRVERQTRSAIYRMTRITDLERYPCLQGLR